MSLSSESYNKISLNYLIILFLYERTGNVMHNSTYAEKIEDEEVDRRKEDEEKEE